MNTEIKKAIIVFLIGFFTFGIGNIFFIYYFSDKAVSTSEGKVIYPMREFVLNLITLGVYGVIWTYRMLGKVDLEEGYEQTSASTLICTVLACLPLRSIVMAVISYRLDSIQTVETD